jgi:gamma-glutamyltranspeptidase/glutathione hydrolase
VVVVKSAFGTRGASTDSHLATRAALEVLEEGGNAFDAAIAASAVLSVVQPHSGGLGGDGFLLAFVGGEVLAYASSGRSPSGFRVEEYLRLRPRRGPLTVTVPGLVNLWGFLVEEYCQLPLDRLLRSAILLAYNGFYSGYALARASKLSEPELSSYRWVRYFRGIEPGSYVVNKEAARTLRTIASRGWDEFYYGRLAEQLITELQDQGVDIGLDDLMDHEGSVVRPLKLELGDLTLYELPPNTQGATTLQLISALYELGLTKYGFDDPRRVTAWSKAVEDSYTFRDLFLGDPEAMEVDVGDYLTYGRVVELLTRRGATGSPGTYVGTDTTFFVVYDGESLVGFIQSLFHPFGSGLIALGFPIQNRGVGFAKHPGLPNSPAPRKRPLHTLSVLGVVSGSRRYVIGCAGGDWRPQIHLRVFENIFVYGMDPATAVDAPRFIYVEPVGAKRVVVEARLGTPEAEGITVERVDYYGQTGLVHVGVEDTSRRVAQLVADPRSEGIALAT